MGSNPLPLPHIAIFPFMAKGHTIPLLHLAQLIHRRRLATLTFFTTPLNVPFLRDYLDGTDSAIIELPFPQDLPEGVPAGVESTDRLHNFHQFLPFLHAVKLLRPQFERELGRLPDVSFLISDGFLGWTNESAAKLGIPRVTFYGMGNFSTSIISVTQRDRPFDAGTDTFTVPGHSLPITVTRDDVPTHHPVIDGFFEEQMRATWASAGLIVNSFYELEAAHYDYWNTNFKPKSWCIGPLCLQAEKKQQQQQQQQSAAYIAWLDARLAAGRPVLYIAFGTQADVSEEQLREIAVGLELSGLDFLWVVRKEGVNLGDGFEERVAERGLVMRQWVDQSAILRHDGVKGFVSHCGWNSVLEGLCAGIPILAWPMMAEQHLNAKLVVEELGVGLRIKTSDGTRTGLVSRGEVEKMVRELMVGEEAKRAAEKAKNVAYSARKAMDIGGSSWQALEVMIDEVCGIKSSVQNVPGNGV